MNKEYEYEGKTFVLVPDTEENADMPACDGCYFIGKVNGCMTAPCIKMKGVFKLKQDE